MMMIMMHMMVVVMVNDMIMTTIAGATYLYGIAVITNLFRCLAFRLSSEMAGSR